MLRSGPGDFQCGFIVVVYLQEGHQKRNRIPKSHSHRQTQEQRGGNGYVKESAGILNPICLEAHSNPSGNAIGFIPRIKARGFLQAACAAARLPLAA